MILDPWFSTLHMLESFGEFCKIQLSGPYLHIGVGVAGYRDLDSNGAEHWFKADLENVMN